MKSKSINKLDQLEIAKEKKEAWFRMFLYSQKRQNLAADTFCNLEIQIASVMFAIMIAFIKNILDNEISIVKIFFGIGLLFLLFSLIFGLINTHLKHLFWGDNTRIFNKCMKEWGLVREGQILNKEAEINCKILCGGQEKIDSPKWAWFSQTIALMISLICIIISIFLIIF